MFFICNNIILFKVVNLMTISTISSKGQIIIPEKLRKKYNIAKGKKFIITDDDKNIILTPISEDYFLNSAGILKGKGKALTELMEEKKREKLL